MKGLIKNFNIIPCGKDEERPKEYQSIISSIYELKKIKKDFISDQFFYKSKNTYNTLKKQYEIGPQCENLERKNFNINWKSVYNSILDKRLNSDMRAMNYKVLNNGICASLKYKTIQKNPCYFCEKKKECREHLFLECPNTKHLFTQIKSRLINKKIDLSNESIYYHIGLNELEDVKLISAFKISIWKLRNLIKFQKIKFETAVFSRIFNKSYFNLSHA